MVKTTSYNPTNKRFRKHFQDFASTKAKKGHLNDNDRDTDEIKHERGVLVKIEKAKITSDGWIVEVGQDENKQTYNCTNTTSILSIPDSTETDLYYVPNSTIDVDITIDTVSSIYQITRIKSLNNHVAYQVDGDLVIGDTGTTSSSDDAETGKITISKTKITIDGDNVVNGNTKTENLSVKNKFKIGDMDVAITIKSLQDENKNLTEKNKKLQDDIDDIKEQIKPLIEG